jgi:hypothetical protein
VLRNLKGTMTMKSSIQIADAQPIKRLVLQRESVRNLGVRSGVRTGSGLVGASGSLNPSFSDSGLSGGGPHISGGSSVIYSGVGGNPSD